ncbi:MAG: hypothetical protein U0Q16_33850 [Bryobacteraceae bacterium]
MGGDVFSVPAGTALTIAPIRLTKGARLRITMQDPGGHLQRNESRPGEKMLVTIGVPGVGYTFVPIVGNTQTDRAYEMLVPRQQNVTVRVASDVFSMADSTGKAVSSAAAGGHVMDIPVPAAGSPPNAVLRITGVRAQ